MQVLPDVLFEDKNVSFKRFWLFYLLLKFHGHGVVLCVNKINNILGKKPLKNNTKLKAFQKISPYFPLFSLILANSDKNIAFANIGLKIVLNYSLIIRRIKTFSESFSELMVMGNSDSVFYL